MEKTDRIRIRKNNDVVVVNKELLGQLGNTSYWMLNKTLVRQLGCEEALLLQHFIDLQFKVFGGNEFFQQYDRIQDELGFGERTVRRIINKLSSADILSVVKKGTPAKNWYTVNHELVLELLDGSSEYQSLQSEGTSYCEVQEQETAKRHDKEKNNFKKELIEKELSNNIVLNIPKEGKFCNWKQVEHFVIQNNLEFIHPSINSRNFFEGSLTFQKASAEKQHQMLKNNTISLYKLK